MHFMDKRLEQKIPGTPAYNEKRKNDHEKREIFLINQQLQKLMHYTPYSMVKEHEALILALKKANRFVVQSTILNLSYRDNFENVQVAVSTVEFLQEALAYLSEDKQRNIRHALQGVIPPLKRMNPPCAQHLRV